MGYNFEKIVGELEMPTDINDAIDATSTAEIPLVSEEIRVQAEELLGDSVASEVSDIASSSDIPTNWFSGSFLDDFSIENAIPDSWWLAGLTLAALPVSYGISIATRLKLNSLLGGKYTVDDQAISVARGFRNALYGSGGILVGGFLGQKTAQWAAEKIIKSNENDGITTKGLKIGTKLGARVLGGMAGAAGGLVINPLVGTINGVHLGLSMEKNIEDTRRGILSAVGAGIAGGAAGFVASAIPFGQLGMNVAGFGVADAWSDRKEANDNGIGGWDRSPGKIKQMGTFIEDIITDQAERTTMFDSLENILKRLKESDDKEEKEKIFKALTNFLPLPYEKYDSADIPNDPALLLQTAAQSIYKVRKKYEKENKLVANFPTPSDIIKNAQLLSKHIVIGALTSSDDIDNALDTTHSDYWGNNRGLSNAILNDDDIKKSIISRQSDDELKDTFKKLDPEKKYNENIDEILDILNNSSYYDAKKNLWSSAEKNTQKNANIDILLDIMNGNPTYYNPIKKRLLNQNLLNPVVPSDQKLKKNFSTNADFIFQKLTTADKDIFWQRIPVPDDSDLKAKYSSGGKTLFALLSSADKNTFWNNVIPGDSSEIIEDIEQYSGSRIFSTFDATKKDSVRTDLESLKREILENIIISQNNEGTQFLNNHSGKNFSGFSDKAIEIYNPATSSEQSGKKESFFDKVRDNIGPLMIAKETWDQLSAIFRKKPAQTSS